MTLLFYRVDAGAGGVFELPYDAAWRVAIDAAAIGLGPRLEDPRGRLVAAWRHTASCEFLVSHLTRRRIGTRRAPPFARGEGA